MSNKRRNQLIHPYMTSMVITMSTSTVLLFIISTESKNKKMKNEILLQSPSLGSVIFCLVNRGHKFLRIILTCQHFIIHIIRNTWILWLLSTDRLIDKQVVLSKKSFCSYYWSLITWGLVHINPLKTSFLLIIYKL